MRVTYLLLAVGAVLPSVAAAQAIPTRILGKAEAEWTEPFSGLNGIRELKNGRVIVSDARDKIIQMIDFKGTATKIGREGAGPGEYGLPLGLYAAPADSTWLYDALNARFLVIDPNGKAVSTFTTAEASANQPAPVSVTPGRGNGRGDGRLDGALGRGGIGFGQPQGIDAMGRLYFRTPTVRFNDGQASVGDSTPVVRWDRKAGKVDTVGVLVNPPTPQPAAPATGSDGTTRVTIRLGGGGPFAAADVWAVTPQGNVAIIRARDYHVDWLINGKTVSGPPIKYDRVKVTDDDKRAYIESRKNSSATMVMNDGAGRKVQNVSAASLDGPGAPVFPEFKGPFRSAIVGPNGQIWVERYMSADSPTTYDIVDGTGKVVSRVVLPKRSRLVGFGNGTAYLIRMDEDDLQFLQRYRL